MISTRSSHSTIFRRRSLFKPAERRGTGFSESKCITREAARQAATTEAVARFAVVEPTSWLRALFTRAGIHTRSSSIFHLHRRRNRIRKQRSQWVRQSVQRNKNNSLHISK